MERTDRDHARFAERDPCREKAAGLRPTTHWGRKAPDPMSGLTASKHDTTWAGTKKVTAPTPSVGSPHTRPDPGSHLILFSKNSIGLPGPARHRLHPDYHTVIGIN